MSTERECIERERVEEEENYENHWRVVQRENERKKERKKEKG
jgi:hypothetical protein